MLNQKLVSIPEVFHCQKTGSRFDHCLVCDTLFGPGTVYMIEKAIRGGEILYEYALCINCYQAFLDDMSTSSRQAVDKYFDQRVEFDLRHVELMAIAPDRVEPWISECVVSRQPIELESEYQVFAFCRGPSLIMNYYPYAIGGTAVDDLLKLLSPKTRDETDRFIEDHLGLSPEVVRGPVDRGVLV